jgi:hypothetical protein
MKRDRDLELAVWRTTLYRLRSEKRSRVYPDSAKTSLAVLTALVAALLATLRPTLTRSIAFLTRLPFAAALTGRLSLATLVVSIALPALIALLTCLLRVVLIPVPVSHCSALLVGHDVASYKKCNRYAASRCNSC